MELLNVKQYFSADLNFVFRMDYRPQHVVYTADDEIEPNASFRKRLAVLQGKELMQATQLADLDPKTVVRRCIKVGLTHRAYRGYRDCHHA